VALEGREHPDGQDDVLARLVERPVPECLGDPERHDGRIEAVRAPERVGAVTGIRREARCTTNRCRVEPALVALERAVHGTRARVAFAAASGS
jgi:hypothetical protein